MKPITKEQVDVFFDAEKPITKDQIDTYFGSLTFRRSMCVQLDELQKRWDEANGLL